MPNRIIRDSARTSPTLAELSDFEERFFWRLVTVADDYGRFEGDPGVLRSLCFPRQSESIAIPTVAAAYLRLTGVGLVRPYVIEGRPFGVFRTWQKQQRVRAKDSRFPPPPEEAPEASVAPSPTAPTDAAVIRQHMLSDDSRRQHMLSDDGHLTTSADAGGLARASDFVFGSDSDSLAVGKAETTIARAREAPAVPVDDEILTAAHAKFPHLQGRAQVVAWAWAEAKGGSPPRDLHALDHLAAVPLPKILASLAHYLATIEARFHSFARFVETFNDHDPGTPPSQLAPVRGARGQPLTGSMANLRKVAARVAGGVT